MDCPPPREAGGPRTDFVPPEMARWFSTAVRELSRHTAGVDRSCRICGTAWPCVPCQQADLALASW
jgi:hypothetical protein